jgi:hypothetical protein
MDSAMKDELRRRVADSERLASEVPRISGKKFSGGRAFAGGFAIDTFLNMKSGDDFGTAAVKGAFTGMLWHTMPGIMTAASVAQIAPAAINGVASWKRQKEAWWNQQFLPNFGGNYRDTQRALTMRQSAVQAIQGSKLNARSALGGEAKLLSQNSNY